MKELSETQERACVVDVCAGHGAGSGIVAICGAHVDVGNFLITNNVYCGVQLVHGADASGVGCTQGGTMDLHDGAISGHLIGANVQTEGFDIERLMDGVVFIDNESNLDMDELPVPEVDVDP